MSSWTFHWPYLLCLTLAVPLLAFGYLRWLRREAANQAQAFPRLRAALRASNGWRRHWAPVSFLAAFLVAIIATARPAILLPVADDRAAIILALDVSNSMRITDIAPTRLDAAKSAIREFVAAQPAQVRIGLVTFWASTAVAQPATRDRESLLKAMDQRWPGSGTDIRRAILTSLEAIFEDSELSVRISPQATSTMGWGDQDIPTLSETARGSFPAVEPGSRGSYAIVLLSDGGSDDAQEAAQLAADMGVRVYTIGIGTDTETANGNAAVFDENALRTIAQITLAEYFYVTSSAELHDVYRTLAARMMETTQPVEVTAWFSALSGLLALSGGVLSLLWFQRLA